MKRYRAADGSYLTIDERAEGFYLAWYLPEDGDFGAYVGDRDLSAEKGSTPEDQKEVWEVNTANDAAKPFSCGKHPAYGFEFKTMTQAKRAFTAANTALHEGGAPLPEWAVLARAAGWTPPKGWKP